MPPKSAATTTVHAASANQPAAVRDRRAPQARATVARPSERRRPATFRDDPRRADANADSNASGAPPTPARARTCAAERDRRVGDEGEEHEHRKPRGPGTAPPAGDPERCREEAERHGADVAHERARGRRVDARGTAASPRPARSRLRRARPPASRHAVGAEAADRHDARETVAAVHEVVQVGAQTTRQRRAPDDGRRRRPPDSGPAATATAPRARADRSLARRDARVHAAKVVDERDGGDATRRREQPAVPRSRAAAGAEPRAPPG